VGNPWSGEYPIDIAAIHKRCTIQALRSVIHCADGTTLSVQANALMYCLPKSDIGPYTHVEIGFPTAVNAELLAYADDPENPLHTVYGYVPLDVLNRFTAAHGGVAVEQCWWMNQQEPSQ
jgi:hypothetical protein